MSKKAKGVIFKQNMSTCHMGGCSLVILVELDEKAKGGVIYQDIGCSILT